MRIFAEKQYLSLINKILNQGVREEGRNGTVIKLIGAQMRFPLDNKSIPLITTKKIGMEGMPKGIIMVYKWKYR